MSLAPETPVTDPQWAMTMFSFTTEIVTGHRTPQQLLMDAASSGLAKQFELDGFEHFRTFPDIGDAEAAEFRSQVMDSNIGLTEIGLYDDRYFSRRGSLSLEERVRFLERQIDSAAKLGFPAVKLMWGADFALLEGLRPALERHGLALYQEAQGALRPDSPELERQLEFAARRPDTFGFVFDLSACMYGAPVTYLEELRRLRVPDAAVDLIGRDWADDRSDTVKKRVLELTKDVDLAPAARMRLMMPFGRFGNSRVAEFRDLIAVAKVVHLKYWDLIDEGQIVSRPIRELDQELRAIGYRGPITSEWGGHEWLEGDDYGAEIVTRRHYAMYQEALAS